MKEIEILELASAQEMVIELKKRSSKPADVSLLKSQYKVDGHSIFDSAIRQDKAIKDAEGKIIRYEKVARIAIPLQKLIVDRAVAFLFGRPVHMSFSHQNKEAKVAADALRLTMLDNKIDSHNRRLARFLMSETEVAELWYTSESSDFWKRVAAKNEDLKTIPKNKIKVHTFAPSLGDKLYPIFNRWGEMTAFSREYTQVIDGQTKTFFESYTSSFIANFKKDEFGVWQLTEKKPNPLKKIPVVYARQEAVEWAEVQPLIDRLEKLLSNFADTNDYHSSPKIFVTGEIRGFAQKGETGAIIEGEPNSTATYLAWQQAPESVKLEIETLLKLIYSSTQTPDISFDSVKGLGAISGVAFKMMFMDAHLKVNNKLEIFNEFFERRSSVVKMLLANINPSLKGFVDEIEFGHSVEPFMIEDKFASAQSLMSASGGKPILSQRSAIELAGLSKDADNELELIKLENEEKQALETGGFI